jgi:hypothetical protein
MVISMLKDMCAADIIAIILILCGTYLVANHINGIVGSILVMVTAYYFGKQKRAA